MHDIDNWMTSSHQCSWQITLITTCSWIYMEQEDIFLKLNKWFHQIFFTDSECSRNMIWAVWMNHLQNILDAILDISNLCSAHFIVLIIQDWENVCLGLNKNSLKITKAGIWIQNLDKNGYLCLSLFVRSLFHKDIFATCLRYAPSKHF